MQSESRGTTDSFMKRFRSMQDFDPFNSVSKLLKYIQDLIKLIKRLNKKLNMQQQVAWHQQQQEELSAKSHPCINIRHSTQSQSQSLPPEDQRATASTPFMQSVESSYENVGNRQQPADEKIKVM